MANVPKTQMQELQDLKRSPSVSFAPKIGAGVGSKEYRVYKSRYLMLAIFAIFSASNSMQWFQYSIVSDETRRFFGVSTTEVTWTTMIYMATYVPLVFPASWLLGKVGLRKTSIIGSCLNCVGAWVKALSVIQNLFWLSFIGHTLVAIAQVFILSVPPRLATVWFGNDQISTACSIGVFGGQLGCALGFVLPPLFVPPGQTIKGVGESFRNQFYFTAGVTTAVFLVILFLFKEAPPTPPTLATETQQTANTAFLPCIRRLLTNRNFILLLFTYGFILSTFYAVSSLLNNVILNHYPHGQEDAGRIGLALMIAGMIGSVVFGFILDKTHRFKATTIFVCCGGIVGVCIYIGTLNSGHIAAVYFAGIFLGFFVTGYMPVGFGYAAELTFPEPENTAAGILAASGELIGVALTAIYEALVTVGDFWANLVSCVFLLCGIVITACIKPELRRQATERSLTVMRSSQRTQKT